MTNVSEDAALAVGEPRPVPEDTKLESTPILQINDLYTEIRLNDAIVHAVDGVSLSVATGTTVGIVGESGSGKTLTGMSIVNLLPRGGYISNGSIRFFGQELVGAPDHVVRSLRGNQIGVIYQDPLTALNPTIRIGRQVAEPMLVHMGMSPREGLKRATELLGRVGVPHPGERVSSYPHELSGGLRQRVMIAMALACEPKLLIADEPTTALDATVQQQILELLDSLKQELSMTVILITHDMGIVANHTDKVVVMYGGRVVEESATVELFSSMAHPYTSALLASIPRVDQDVTKPLDSIPGAPPDLASRQSGCRFAPRCRYASEPCEQHEPVLAPVATGHLAACHFPLGPDHVPDASSAVRVSRHGGNSRDHAGGASNEVIARLDEITRRYVLRGTGGLALRTRYVRAVDGVSLSIRRFETLGLVGESGCGKTTLGRIIAALDSPDDGRVLFEERDIARYSRRVLRRVRRDLQFMFQDPYSSLDPRMRVASIVEEPLVATGYLHKKEARERVAELMGQVGLPLGAVDRRPHEFSGGQRQRIGLARALALHPKLIVADEPVSALDVSIRSQILNLMKELQAQHGLTYVVISHDLAAVRYLSDRIAVMYLGKIVEIGPASAVYERSHHPYTEALLSAIPVPHPLGKRTLPRAAILGELPSPASPPSGCRFRTRCPYAREVCREVEPMLVERERGHWSACHFSDEVGHRNA